MQDDDLVSKSRLEKTHELMGPCAPFISKAEAAQEPERESIPPKKDSSAAKLTILAPAVLALVALA